MKLTRDGRWSKVPLAGADKPHITTADVPRHFRLEGLGLEIALARAFGTGLPLVLQRGAAHPQWAAIVSLETDFAALAVLLDAHVAAGRATAVPSEALQPFLFHL